MAVVPLLRRVTRHVGTKAPKKIEDHKQANINFKFEWTSSTADPHRVVIDDNNILDLDGWQNLIKDHEDAQAVREALQKYQTADIGPPRIWAWKHKEIKALNRTHNGDLVTSETRITGYYVANETGCARTEAIVVISDAEKSKYLPHLQKENNNERPAELDSNHVRSIRTQNRRLVAEKGPNFHSNFKNRKKRLRVARSKIHKFGVFAEERIKNGDYIVDYLGEVIRGSVANLREALYQRSGIGSTYMFTLKPDENPADDIIIDGTRRGNIARFINDSHKPNCMPKVIQYMGKETIGFYAICDIAQDTEITFDYKLKKDNGDIQFPCVCGADACPGYM